jgi:hypothetical protein
VSRHTRCRRTNRRQIGIHTDRCHRDCRHRRSRPSGVRSSRTTIRQLSRQRTRCVVRRQISYRAMRCQYVC